MRIRSFISLATSLAPTALSVALMMTPVDSHAGENSHSKSAFRASAMRKMTAPKTTTASSNPSMGSSASSSSNMMRKVSSSNMNKKTTTGNTMNLSKSVGSGMNTSALNTSARKMNGNSLGTLGLKKTSIGGSGLGMSHVGTSSNIGVKTAGSPAIGNLKGSAPWLKSGSMTGIGKSLGSKGIDVSKTTGTIEGTGLPPAPGGPIPMPYPNTGEAGKFLKPDLISKTQIGDLIDKSQVDSNPPSADPEPDPSDGSDPAPGSGSGSDAGSEPGSGGGSGGGSDPADDHDNHPHHHDHCYWDIHVVQPYFHTHCWHPAESCYVIWVYRSGSWVNEKVTDLAPLSNETPLEFIAVSEPTSYEYDETLADGTVVHKTGVWWMGADGNPHGQENWSAVVLGPEMANAFKALPPQP